MSVFVLIQLDRTMVLECRLKRFFSLVVAQFDIQLRSFVFSGFKLPFLLCCFNLFFEYRERGLHNSDFYSERGSFLPCRQALELTWCCPESHTLLAEELT